MNKNRRPMDAKTRKQANKAIKEAQKTLVLEAPPRSDKLAAQDLIKKYPKKIAKTEESIAASFKKTVETKKKKLLSPHSRRSTPGTVVGQPGSPSYPNLEGTRWNKTLTLQNKIKGKMLTKKLSKKR